MQELSGRTASVTSMTARGLDRSTDHEGDGLSLRLESAAGSARNPDGQTTVVAFPRRRLSFMGMTWRAMFAATAVVAFMMMVVLFSPFLALQEVRVEGLNNISQSEVTNVLKPLMGKSLTQISDEEATSLLRSIEGIKSSTIRRLPPETLLVRLVERTPVAVLKKDNTFALVDEVGHEVGTVSDPASVQLPVIDGQATGIDTEAFKAITSVLMQIPGEIRSQLVSASPSSAQGVQFTLAGDKKVLWGDTTEGALKASVLATLLKGPPPPPPGQPPPPPVREYDVSAPHHPVTR